MASGLVSYWRSLTSRDQVPELLFGVSMNSSPKHPPKLMPKDQARQSYDSKHPTAHIIAVEQSFHTPTSSKATRNLTRLRLPLHKAQNIVYSICTCRTSGDTMRHHHTPMLLGSRFHQDVDIIYNSDLKLGLNIFNM